MTAESTPSGEATPDYVAELRRLGDVLRVIQELVTETREEIELAARNHQHVRLNRIPANMQEWALRLLAEKDLERVPESISCDDCDASCDSLQQALHEGWIDLNEDLTGMTWNYLGHCPDCQKADEEEFYRLNPHIEREDAPATTKKAQGELF